MSRSFFFLSQNKIVDQHMRGMLMSPGYVFQLKKTQLNFHRNSSRSRIRIIWKLNCNKTLLNRRMQNKKRNLTTYCPSSAIYSFIVWTFFFLPEVELVTHILLWKWFVKVHQRHKFDFTFDRQSFVLSPFPIRLLLYFTTITCPGIELCDMPIKCAFLISE